MIPDFTQLQMVRRDLIIEGRKIRECLRDTVGIDYLAVSVQCLQDLIFSPKK